ncbi:BT_3928 family protein [Neotamlana laminarinivorans]|uniref:DoxX family membrane protein n=1 Tax=Neotamlana laminarinivorans TaxID=2883124 RepID=A0A9X1L584_9FLAO|nr:BT_3928 family protein [Tamlana laminarinivorans]MCB4800157.1 DoxX family membrane protein [Tamlana laminarinivorans]
MKILVSISRIFVGVLFIISGLIKLNDPLGFSYKLQEYFSPDVLNLPFLEPYALAISVLVVVFEVVLGVFLLIGYKSKFTVWSLLLMIVFFTFLTFYSAYFDKVKDCGCFGDALKLTPWESFTKDVILLVFILILVIGKKYINPIFGKLTTTIIALLSFILSLWFGYYVLMHLPAKDFRAYKIGANISEGMTVPEDAPKAETEYYWKFKVNGEEKVITTMGSYPSVEGDFIGVETKVIKEGYQPPIYDFSIETEEEDLTTHFLSEENLIVIISYSLEHIEREGALKLKQLQDTARKNGYQVIGLTASGEDTKKQINKLYNLDLAWYLCDEKALKTVVRANPGIIELDKGTVKQKVHWNDIEDLKLPLVETKPKPFHNHEEEIGYFVNDSLSTKQVVEAINPEKVDSVNVVKDEALVKKFNKENNTSFTALMHITLKPE